MRDQYSYTAEALLRHIECLWVDEYVLRTVDPSEVPSRSDPGIQSELPAVVADVRRAWARSGLDATERQVFTLRHFWQMDLTTIGEVYDMAPDEVALMLDQTYELLLNAINGKKVRANG